MNRVVTALRPWEKENGLLNVGRQIGQVHDLAYASATNVSESGQVGITFHHAVAEHLLETKGQRHEAGNARHSARFARWARGRLACLHFASAPSAAPVEVNVALIGQ